MLWMGMWIHHHAITTTIVCPDLGNWPKSWVTAGLQIGGPVEKTWSFQMAPTLFLSVQSCATRCQYDTLKVSLKTNDQNLPVGCTEHWNVLHTNKMPGFTCYLSYILKSERAHACGTFEVCRTVHMYVWKMYVKFRETILTLSGPLGLRQIG